MGVSGVPDIRESGQIREWPAASPGQYLAYQNLYSSGSFFLIRRVGQCRRAPEAPQSGSAGGRKTRSGTLRKNVEEVITKGGKATSERSAGCANSVTATLEGGPNIIMAHQGVHGSGKKKDIQRCRHTPPDARARRTSSLQVSCKKLCSRRSFGRRLTFLSRCSRRSMPRCAPMAARCRAHQTSTSGCPPDLLTYRRTSENCRRGPLSSSLPLSTRSCWRLTSSDGTSSTIAFTRWASCSIRYCIRSTSSTGLAW